MSNLLTLPRYEAAVKRMLIVFYIRDLLDQLPPDEFVDSLNRIFKHKRKVIRHLALYVQREAEERGHPTDKVLSSLGFYAQILKQFINRAGNQPLKR